MDPVPLIWPSGPSLPLLPFYKQAFTSPTALKLLEHRHMGSPSSALWEGSGGPAPSPAREKPRVWGAGWHQAGALLCSCGSQEGAAPELRPINKVSGRNGFNLHFTYWCLLCYFQYGNLIL